MKKKTPLRTIITIVIITGAIVLLVKNFWIPDFNCISPGILYTSGQPRGMDYTRLLYKYHIGTIINLRSSAEHREQNWYNEEMTWIHSNGVKYFEFPLERNVNDSTFININSYALTAKLPCLHINFANCRLFSSRR